MEIDPEKWYAAREVPPMLDDITLETIKRYCRDGKFKKAKQFGPKKQWHVQGSDILRLRAEWGLDAKSG